MTKKHFNVLSQFLCKHLQQTERKNATEKEQKENKITTATTDDDDDDELGKYRNRYTQTNVRVIDWNGRCVRPLIYGWISLEKEPKTKTRRRKKPNAIFYHSSKWSISNRLNPHFKRHVFVIVLFSTNIQDQTCSIQLQSCNSFEKEKPKTSRFDIRPFCTFRISVPNGFSFFFFCYSVQWNFFFR